MIEPKKPARMQISPLPGLAQRLARAQGWQQALHAVNRYSLGIRDQRRQNIEILRVQSANQVTEFTEAQALTHQKSGLSHLKNIVPYIAELAEMQRRCEWTSK
ncbi:MAG: hypothetical protein ABIR56_09595 [Polaromonas sp.]